VLGDSLNSMAGRIERQVGEITGERDRARVLISSLVEGVVAVSDSGHVMLINPAARRLLGLERASRSGKSQTCRARSALPSIRRPGSAPMRHKRARSA